MDDVRVVAVEASRALAFVLHDIVPGVRRFGNGAGTRVVQHPAEGAMVDALLERHVGVGAGGHSRRDGDLAWLGLLLSLVSALMVVGLVWWLVG